MTDIFHKIQDILKRPDISKEELVQLLRNMILDYDVKQACIKSSVPLAELYNQALTQYESHLPENQAIISNYKGFDALSGGFYPGELVVIGGRPAMGKTQLLVNLALNFSPTYPVLYYSFDLSSILLSNRFLSALSKIEGSRILQRNLTPKEDDLLRSLHEKISEHKIYVNNSGYNSVSVMKSQMLQHIREHGVKIVIIDYLQLMSSSRFRNNRELEVSSIVRELKNLASDHGLCIIAASQLSRAVESRGGSGFPNLTDLRESGAIEQDADKVVLIYRPEYYHLKYDDEGNSTDQVMILIMAKNRTGKLGQTRLMRDPQFTSFTDYIERTASFNIQALRLDDFDRPN